MTPFGGFIINRKVFNHPMFKGNARCLFAWEWLIAKAAYKPAGGRLRYGVVDLQRGQLAITLRDLAAAWGWRKSSVFDFLRRLQDEQMITCRPIRAQLRTKTRTTFTQGATLITICNYDKFQKFSTRHNSKSGQESGQLLQQVFDFAREKTPKQLNQLVQQVRVQDGLGKGRGAPRTADYKPQHCAKSPDGKVIWCDYGTSEWEAYAADYEKARGTAILPERRIGGAGHWFWYAGEEYRPVRDRQRRA